MRVLSSHELLFDFKAGKKLTVQELQKQKAEGSYFAKMLDTIMITSSRPIFNALVLHVHGGGFVSMSSGSH